MCTVSWILHPSGHELFCNRDERLERPTASGPELVTNSGARYLAPRDTEAGGTWIAVNEHGLSLCLLNRWGPEPSAPPPPALRGGRVVPEASGTDLARAWRSRGLLVTDLAGEATAGAVLERLTARDLTDTQPFTLLVLHGAGAPTVRAWDGARLKPVTALDGNEHRGLLVSGGTDPGRLASARASAFRAAVPSAVGPQGSAASDASARQSAFHRAHEPVGAAPCVHRETVRTVSFTHVAVGVSGAPEASLRYAPGPPCTTALGPALSLPLLTLPQRGARA